MKVLLVRPPYNRLKGYHPSAYFPVGIGYIAAVLEQAGHHVRIWNADATDGIKAGIMPDEVTMLKERKARWETLQQALHDDNHAVWQEVRQVLHDFNPDVVGLSVLTPEVGSAAKFSQLAKQTRKDRVVIWGGHHSTFLPEDVLSYGDIDVVVRGEGEVTAVELLQSLSAPTPDLSQVNGISYIDNGRIVHNPERELIHDLDAVPFPAHHLSLFPDAFKKIDRIGIMTNRGCPFKCGYCASPEFTMRRVRHRSYDNVIAEIKHVTQFYNNHVVSFLDDNFTINKRRVRELCEHLINADVKVSWDTMTRADILDEETVKLMKQANCCGLSIGIESGSERMLKIIKKGVKLEKVVSAFELMYQYDIPSGANFMAGFPEDTLDDIEATFALMKQVKTENINFNIFEPIPGSPLLEDCKRMQLVPDPIDWRTFGFWPMHHFVRDIPPEVFQQKVYEVTQWVYDYKCSVRVRWMRIKPYIKNDPLYPFKKIVRSLKYRVMKRLVN